VKRLKRAAQNLAWRAYTTGAAKLHDLTYLFWETTLACNLGCRHCGSSCAPNSALPGELSTQEVKDAFSSLAEDSDAKRIAVAVTGGEPLLRADVFEVAAHFAGLGFRWGMVTNGTLITDRVVQLCRASGMGSVALSIDGLKDDHEFLRGKGSFNPAVAGFGKLKRGGFLEVAEIVSCPTPRMIPHLDAVYRQMQELGADQWRIIPLAPIGRAKHDPTLLLSGPELRELLEFIKDKRAEKNPAMKITLDEEGFLGQEYEREVRDMPYFCFAGIHAASILADGTVSACPSVSREFVQGSIRERRFSEIWENEFAVYRDRRWMKTGECESCASFADCRGNSMHLWDSPAACGPNRCHLRLLETPTARTGEE
jgi:radical SAM protein with 4Fe4S-binding SPASM domain